MTDEVNLVAAWKKQQIAAIERCRNAFPPTEPTPDERHAAGYQAAIADVVEWLRSGDAFALTDHEAAQEITRHFGKGQDQNPVK